ncbi:unnamed protein product, partial [Amoebophrya sp. A120]
VYFATSASSEYAVSVLDSASFIQQRSLRTLLAKKTAPIAVLTGKSPPKNFPLEASEQDTTLVPDPPVVSTSRHHAHATVHLSDGARSEKGGTVLCTEQGQVQHPGAAEGATTSAAASCGPPAGGQESVARNRHRLKYDQTIDSDVLLSSSALNKTRGPGRAIGGSFTSSLANLESVGSWLPLPRSRVSARHQPVVAWHQEKNTNHGTAKNSPSE